jgi:mercuric ion transport protein
MTVSAPNDPSPTHGRTALLLSGVAALLASSCCLGPLVLILLGVSGAWIGNLTALEPYRPIFISVALVALFFAWRGLWRAAITCRSAEVCAIPAVQRGYRLLFGGVVVLVLIALGFPYLAPWFY